MEFPALKEAQGKLDAKRKEAQEIFDQAGPTIDFSKVKGIAGVSDAKGVIAHIRALNDEMGDLQKEVNDLEGVKSAADRLNNKPEASERGFGGLNADNRPKSLGELFINSSAYKSLYNFEGLNTKSRNNTHIGTEANLDIELKTTMTTAAGWAPQAIRIDRVVPSAQRPIQVTDVIPQYSTAQSAVVFMEETTFTNNAAETAENSAYGESALAFTERTSTVRKIATFLPVTDEQLEDVPGIQSYLDQRLPFMVQQRLDLQIVAGDGSSPNLRGLLNVASIQTQAKGADSTPDAVLKAITKVRVTGRSAPNVVLVHSTDWQNVRLLKDANGQYIWGGPTAMGPEQIWGLPVVQTETTTAGTAIVLDTSYTGLYIRRGLDVQVSNSHASYFINGLQAIRADIRAAFVAFRPAAICTVTGL